MTIDHGLSRRGFLKSGALVISFSLLPTGGMAEAANTSVDGRPLTPDQLDAWLSIAPDGQITAFFGKMDMGQGTDTGVVQMVAEELDVPFARVTLVQSDTARCVDQGGASSATGVERGGTALRNAAAEARRVLVELASQRLGIPADQLEVNDGVVTVIGDPTKAVSYGELAGGQLLDTPLEWNGKFGNSLGVKGKARIKDPATHKIVGTDVPRMDQPGRVFATDEMMPHLRVPDLLHGRMVRPPLPHAVPVAVDEGSIADIAGARVVWQKGFIGVVAETEWDAIRAAESLAVTWTEPTDDAFPTSSEELHAWIRDVAEVGGEGRDLEEGDVEAALAAADAIVEAEYHWPIQSHARMAPACGLVDLRQDGITVYSDSQKPFDTTGLVAELTARSGDQVRAIWVPGAGSYGRSDCGDGTADAAVLAKATGRPVRVQWSRMEGMRWDPKGPASVVRMRAGVGNDGSVHGYHFHIKGLSRVEIASREGDASEVLAGQLLGVANTPEYQMRTPEDTYGFADKLYEWQAVKPLRLQASPLRTAHFRDPLGPDVHFASESFIDEIAAATKTDPVEFRLKHLTGERDKAVVQLAAERSGWVARPSPNPEARDGNILRGRGIAYAIRTNSINAIVAEVEVNEETGQIFIRRFVVAADQGEVINPKTLTRTIEGNLLQATSRTLIEEVVFDRNAVHAEDWFSYPILETPDVPGAVEVAMINRPELGPYGAGEASTRVTPPAIANAFFDATGVRLRRVPFTRERVLSALQAQKG